MARESSREERENEAGRLPVESREMLDKENITFAERRQLGGKQILNHWTMGEVQ